MNGNIQYDEATGLQKISDGFVGDDKYICPVHHSLHPLNNMFKFNGKYACSQCKNHELLERAEKLWGHEYVRCQSLNNNSKS